MSKNNILISVVGANDLDIWTVIVKAAPDKSRYSAGDKILVPYSAIKHLSFNLTFGAKGHIEDDDSYFVLVKAERSWVRKTLNFLTHDRSNAFAIFGWAILLVVLISIVFVNWLVYIGAVTYGGLWGLMGTYGG